MNYKEKQEKYREMCKKVISVYDSGKRCNRKGEVRIKGIPFVNEEKRKLKEERKAKKEERKNKIC